MEHILYVRKAPYEVPLTPILSLCSRKWFKKSLFICLHVIYRKKSKEEENNFKDSVINSTFYYLGSKAWTANEKGFQVKRLLTTRMEREIEERA